MSTSTLCKNCQADALGEEICPSCFAPQVHQPSRYTLDVAQAARSQNVTPVTVILPELQTVSFRPSSSLSRLLTRMRGGIATGLVVLIVALVALFLGFRNEKIRAHEADRIATAAFEEKNFGEAGRLWVKAAGHYDSVFDETAQAAALEKSIKAYLAGNFYQKSLELVEQSGELYDTPCAEKQAKIYRTWGNYNLEESRQHLSSEAFESAFTAATHGLEHYELGEGSEEQLAAAHRESARALAELHDFSDAKKQIKKAVDLEGRTKANILVSKMLTRRQLAYEKSKLADSKKHRYISDKGIPVVEVQKPVSLRQTRSSSRSQGNTYRSPRSNRPTVGEATAYPTKQRAYPTYQDPYQTRTYQPTRSRRTSRVPSPRQPNVYKPPVNTYKPPVNTYKPPTSYPRTQRRSSSSGPTTWSGVQKRPMGGSGSYR